MQLRCSQNAVRIQNPINFTVKFYSYHHVCTLFSCIRFDSMILLSSSEPRLLLEDAICNLLCFNLSQIRIDKNNYK